MTFGRIWLCLSLALAAAQASAEGISRFTLENGLEAVVIEDHRAPVVVHMVWYRAGAADEARGTSGVAHFLEHLMFKGTDELAPGELSATVEANGGSDNAFTSHDYTAYFQRIAADRLELVMRMEADRMRDLVLSEDDWATELQVIIEERNQRIDSDPGALLREQMNAAQYLNHPYGTPVIGWRHEMEALTRADAQAWYDRYYAPNNAVLVVAGDVDPAEVERLARLYYGVLAPTEGLGERQRVAEPPQLAERRLTYADPRVQRPYVTRSYLAPERNAGDQSEAAALTVLAELLGGNAATSVLGRALVFDSGKAIAVRVSYDGTSHDETTFGITVVPAAGVSLADAEAALDEALAAFLRDGPDPAQFARISTQISASEIYTRDNVQGMARRYGEALTSGLAIADVQGWPEALRAVSEADVMAAAEAVLVRRRSVTAWLMRPEAEGVRQ
ncbi:MAG: pitrilysin family protein [Phaeovulum sp.]|uniref:M16 family metallopeptidase n=1 Tax=Phaeovulum sp. TaxID=2934796 RepID=UPI0027310327|nr:pitrilysin family protein [Phaeovulum sp.]MDP2061887.1 pitrilysin family protein [Phaeovulum sp.]